MRSIEREAAEYLGVLARYGRVNRTLLRRSWQRAEALTGRRDWRGWKVLNIGSGAGWETDWLIERGTEVTAMDVTWTFLALGLGRSVHYVQGDGMRLPFRDDAFDLVVMNGTLHHIPDTMAALRECRRVGRRLLVVREPREIPGLRWIMKLVRWNLEYDGLDTLRFSDQRLKAQTRKAGYGCRVLTEWSFCPWFPPDWTAPVITRLFSLLNRAARCFGNSVTLYGEVNW